MAYMYLDTAARGRLRLPISSIVDRRMVALLERETFGWASEHETVYEEGGVFALRGKMHSYYLGLDEAIAALHHELDFYGNRRRGEVAKLGDIGRQVDSLLETFLDIDRLGEAEDFSSIVAGLADWLSGASDQDKAAARRDLQLASSAKDRLGRRNPWRQKLLLGQTSLALEKRLLAIDAIKRKDGERMIRAVRYYRRCAVIARLVKETLGALFKSGNWAKITLLPEAVAAQKMELLLTNVELDRTLILLKGLVRELEFLVVRPFLVFRNLTLGDIYTAIGALQAGKQFVAKFALERAFSGSRIALARVRLTRIRWDVRQTRERGKDVDIQTFMGRLVRFRDNLSQIDGRWLVADCLGLVGAMLAVACDALGNRQYDRFDQLLEDAIRLL